MRCVVLVCLISSSVSCCILLCASTGLEKPILVAVYLFTSRSHSITDGGDLSTFPFLSVFPCFLFSPTLNPIRKASLTSIPPHPSSYASILLQSVRTYPFPNGPLSFDFISTCTLTCRFENTRTHACRFENTHQQRTRWPLQTVLSFW